MDSGRDGRLIPEAAPSRVALAVLFSLVLGPFGGRSEAEAQPKIPPSLRLQAERVIE